MANARFEKHAPGRRALKQLARVLALSSALAVIGGIVVSDVFAAEPEADADALLDGELDAEAEVEVEVEVDDVLDAGGPLALTTRYGMPDAPKVAVNTSPTIAGSPYAALDDPLKDLDGLSEEERAKKASGVKPKRKRKRSKKKRRRGKKFKFGRMDAY